MSKKDYTAIAKVFALQTKCPRLNGKDTIKALATTLSGVLAHNNPKFDVKKFLLACNVIE